MMTPRQALKDRIVRQLTYSEHEQDGESLHRAVEQLLLNTQSKYNPTAKGWERFYAECRKEIDNNRARNANWELRKQKRDNEFRTITFTGRVGLLPREKLIAKYPGKGVSHLQIGDVLQVKQHPYDQFVHWIQVRIRDIGDTISVDEILDIVL